MAPDLPEENPLDMQINETNYAHKIRDAIEREWKKVEGVSPGNGASHTVGGDMIFSLPTIADEDKRNEFEENVRRTLREMANANSDRLISDNSDQLSLHNRKLKVIVQDKRLKPPSKWEKY